MSTEPEKPPMKHLNIRVEEDIHTQLKVMAAQQKTTVTELVQTLIVQALQPKPAE